MGKAVKSEFINEENLYTALVNAFNKVLCRKEIFLFVMQENIGFVLNE